MSDEMELHDIHMENFMWLVLIAVMLIVGGIAMTKHFDPKPDAHMIEQTSGVK
jgi:hypothetical protein